MMTGRSGAPGRLAAVLAVVATLAGCSNATETSAGKLAVQKTVALFKKAPPAAAAAPVTRASLEQFNAPILQVDIASTAMTLYVVPIARNGSVQTWSTSSDITLALRDGVLATTRGIGPDLIESRTPNLATLRAGSGTTSRSAGFLDGGDRLVTFQSACSLSTIGTEPLVVLDVQQSARHVQESCQADGFSYVNDYWFDSAGKILKSKEFLAPGVGHAVVSRLIDS